MLMIYKFSLKKSTNDKKIMKKNNQHVELAYIARDITCVMLHYKLHVFSLIQGGIVKLQWDKLSPLIYTSCLDGIVRLWDSRNGQVASQWTGHTDSILDFEISRYKRFTIFKVMNIHVV